MKKLNDFKNDINKCSKCGLCQSVCPVYKETGNDCAVSRGKFVMLDGVLKGDLKLNKNINKYLDLCLKCGKCTDFCPSGIDVCKIFETAKYQYAKNTLTGKIIFFLQSKLVFGNFINFFKHITKPFRKSIKGKSQKSLKLLYFKGCVNNLCPKNDNYLNKILKNSDVEIIEKDFDCCGLPFLSSGNLERFEQVKNHNLKMLDCDFDYILIEGAGGITCPLRLDRDEKYLLKDLIKELETNIVIVADGGLGTINSTLLTVDYARANGIDVAGIILNNFEPDNFMHQDNLKQVEYLTGVPVVATVEKGQKDIILLEGLWTGKKRI